MTLALEAFTKSIQASTLHEIWGDGELVITPWEFRDGEPVIVYAKQVDADRFVVTDRGQATDNLANAGLDLGRESVRRSWNAVRESLPQPLQKFGTTESEWVLATQSDTTSLGEAITHVAQAAMRADGLRALIAPPRKPRQFADWVVREAADRDLSVLPFAEISSGAGIRRRVTVKIHGRQDAYVQAVGRRQDAWEAFDKVRSLFMDSTVPRQQRFALIEEHSPITSAQREGMALHSNVIEQRSVSVWLDDLAA